MSTPFVSDYLKVAADSSDRPVNPVDDDPGTNVEMLAFRYEADTQTLIFWDPINEEYLTIPIGGPGVVDADDVTYDNSGSGAAAVEVQAALDEAFAAIAGLGAAYTDEEARDALGTALVAGNGIDIAVSDGSDTITLTSDYALLATSALSGGETSVDFSSISSGYKDLILVYQARSTAAGAAFREMGVRFNNDSTGGNYHWQNNLAFGATEFAAEATAPSLIRLAAVPSSTADAGNAAQFEGAVINYAGTTFRKTVVGIGVDPNTSGSGSGVTIGQFSGLWESTAAINRVTFVIEDGSAFAAGSVFSIYGRK